MKKLISTASSYTLTMVRWESDTNPLQDNEMVQAEHALWDDLVACHLDLSFKTDEEAASARNVYANDVVGCLVVLQQEAAHNIGCT